MDRQSVAVLCAIGALLTVGCMGLQSPEPGAPSVHVQNLTLQQGESGALTIEATNVSRMSVTDYPMGENNTIVEDLLVELDSSEVTFEPNVNTQMDSYPPVWVWNDVESTVTVRIPVEAPDDATTGSYAFEITAEKTDSDGNNTSATDDATVRIVDRGEGTEALAE